MTAKSKTTKAKTKAKRGRKNPTIEEMAAIEQETEDARTLDSRVVSDGVKKAELFHLQYPADAARYHEIINNRDQYVILESDFTWDKEKGSTVGVTIFLFYVDRFAETK